MLTSDEFMTEGGLRCRAIRHKSFPGYPDYHGSSTTWPKETHEVANGFRHFGYHDLASNLDKKLLDAVSRSGEFYEFFYANDDGTIWKNHIEALEILRQTFGDKTTLPYPEAGQAWTISAVMAIVQR
jgi:glycogen debranching enzyme